MVAYTLRMPSGIPGEINRVFHCTVEAQVITPSGTTGAPTAYGLPLVVDATAGNVGRMRMLATGENASNTVTIPVYGFLARPFPAHSSQDALGVSTPPPSLGPCDVLRVGYMSVKLAGSSAAVKGAPVYIWTGAVSGTHVLGGVESTSPGANGFTLGGATFMGPADAAGNVEISIDCRTLS